jgi:hypothetical protein
LFVLEKGCSGTGAEVCMAFVHDRWSEDELSSEYGYLAGFQPWGPWRQGDAPESSLVSFAERAVTESARMPASQMTLDESNGLLMVLAGSLIFDIVREIGGILLPARARVNEAELPAWITDETWSFDDAGLNNATTASAIHTRKESRK